MSLRADSYSSIAEVTAFTRHLLDGQAAFNTTTQPTATELEKFIDRASASLNVALEGAGFSSPITSTANSTASLLCDDFVTMEAAAYVELTQRGQGYGSEEGSRVGTLRGLYSRANKFVEENTMGLIRVGVTQTYKKADGLAFTATDAYDERADHDDDTLEQPLFRRRQFDQDRPT